MHPEKKEPEMAVMLNRTYSGGPGYLWTIINKEVIPAILKSGDLVGFDGQSLPSTGYRYGLQWYSDRMKDSKKEYLPYCNSDYHRLFFKRAARRSSIGRMEWTAQVSEDGIHWYLRCAYCDQIMQIVSRREQVDFHTFTDLEPRRGWLSGRDDGETFTSYFAPVDKSPFITLIGACAQCMGCSRHFWFILDRRTS